MIRHKRKTEKGELIQCEVAFFLKYDDLLLGCRTLRQKLEYIVERTKH